MIKNCLLLLTIFALLCLPTIASAEGDVAILSPADGEGVLGQVMITGYIKSASYTGYELEFAFSGKEDAGWYPIADGDKLGADQVFGIWDTTGISDGEYSLRLSVRMDANTISQDIVSGIRVRNYSIMETSTPSAEGGQTEIIRTNEKINLIPSESTGKTIRNNPAAISPERFNATVIIAGVIGLLIALLLGVKFFKDKDGR